MVGRAADVLPIETDGRVHRKRLEQLRQRNRGIAEGRAAGNLAEERIRHALLQRRTERQLFGRELVEVRIGHTEARDGRPDIRQPRREGMRQVAFGTGMPLLRIPRPLIAINGKHTLPEAGGGREGEGGDRRPRGEHEGRRDAVEAALTHRLQERKCGGGERRGDAGHVDPDERIPATHARLRTEALRQVHARPEVVRMQAPHTAGLTVAAGKLDLLRRQVEGRRLVAHFRRGVIERVAQARMQRRALAEAPLVLRKIFLHMRPVADGVGLQVDGIALDLAEQEARQRMPRSAHAWLVGKERTEGELPRRQGGLEDVEAGPSQVGPGLDEVRAPEARHAAGDLRDAGRQVGRGAGRRPQLLVASDDHRRQCRARQRRREHGRRQQRQTIGRGRLAIDGAARVTDAHLGQQTR